MSSFIGMSVDITQMPDRPEAILGAVWNFPVQMYDIPLGYLDGTTGIPIPGSSSDLYEPKATDLLVNAKGKSGDHEMVYVFNDSGSDMAEGVIAEHNLAQGLYHVQENTTIDAVNVAGITLHTIPNGKYGWLLVRGVHARVFAAGAVAVGASLSPGTSPFVVSAPVPGSSNTLGFAITASGGPVGQIEMRVDI